MGFTTGAKVLADIIDEIANGLIATNLWHNVDTTWNTLLRTANNARRVLAYGPAGAVGKGNTILSADLTAGTNIVSVASVVNFSAGNKIVIGPAGINSEVRVVTVVGATTLTLDANVNTAHFIGERCANVDLEIYVALEAINTTINYFYSGGWYYGKGPRIVFSATWDSVAHIYPSSNQSTFIGFEGAALNVGTGADLATLQITYYLWIESNGFVITGKPEPHADTRQGSFFTCIERNSNKEYSDGYTNFYCVALMNIDMYGYYDGVNVPLSINRFRVLLRPFAYQYGDGGGTYNHSPNGSGISFVPTPSYYAYKSIGNGKVYYIKPIVHNVAGQTTPIFQAELWFPWTEAVGLIDGDVIAIEGQTTKFICKALDSTDSLNRLVFAMKYVA